MGATSTGVRPSKPIRENKRRRVATPEGDKDTVSRQRCQQGATNLLRSFPMTRQRNIPNPLSP